MQQKKHSKRLIIPIFLNHKGCPYRCIFCNQKSSVGIGISNEKEIDCIVKKYINSQIEKYGRINPKYEKVQIAFYGGSFTCLDNEKMIKFLEKGKKYIDNNLVHSLRVSTRPDCINKDIIRILKNFSVETVELGCESFSDRILTVLKRGHSVKDILNSYKLLKQNNFEVCLQVMIGLPTEKEIDRDILVDYLIRLKPDFVRIFPLIVLKNTEIEKWYFAGKYEPLKLEEAISILVEIYKKCVENNIKIIQIGLHYSTHLLNNFIAGPLHPSLGALVLEKVNLMDILQ